MAEVNLPAGHVGVAVLQAGTPESLEAVVNKWLDNHLSAHVVSMELQAGNASGPLHLLVVYRMDRRGRVT